MIRPKLLWLALCCGPAAGQTLETITVYGADEDSGDAAELRDGASNDTLGGFLASQPHVATASYGEGVGRPVVRGMSGYRVKILHNDHEASDLSAMSQDHAVAVAPRAAQRIELLRGPASLLYAARAGGVIRLIDALDTPIPPPGLQARASAQARLPDPDGHGLDAELSLGSSRRSLLLSALRQSAGDYRDGDGRRVHDADTRTGQWQLALGWQPRADQQWQLHTTRLYKDYGIPNRTEAATRIDMRRADWGLKFRHQPASAQLDEVAIDLLDSDYLHDETEGGRADGLFGQRQRRLAAWAHWNARDWWGSARVDIARGELQVCHEHGRCEDFESPGRSGEPLGSALLQYLQSTGLPYSHGHPMPDTRDRSVQLSAVGNRPLGTELELSLAARWQHRALEADPDNLQEQWVYPDSVDPHYYHDRDDHSLSLSAGLLRYADAARPGWELNLSYLQRFPSADELYWNGFHHATDSYVFGDPALERERSLNLDLDIHWQLGGQRLQLSTFYYRFEDYIYQARRHGADGEALADPFHSSPVWTTEQSDARFLGASLRLESDAARALSGWAQLDWLDAERANGDTLPRTAPPSLELGLQYRAAHWRARGSVRRVLRARALAPHESSTPGYAWLGLRLERRVRVGGQTLTLALRGDNLLDVAASNHLSVLKQTAPLPGRQLAVELDWTL